MNTNRRLQLLEVLVVVTIVAVIASKVFFIHRSFSQRPTTFGIVFAIVWLVWRILSSRKTR